MLSAFYICCNFQVHFRLVFVMEANSMKTLEKRDPSEIERTTNIRKQQTRFYWVCSWELMESATNLTPPSTGLSGILLSIRTQYSWRTRIWKNINNISMHGESFTNSSQKQQQLVRPLNKQEKSDLASYCLQYRLPKNISRWECRQQSCGWLAKG